MLWNELNVFPSACGASAWKKETTHAWKIIRYKNNSWKLDAPLVFDFGDLFQILFWHTPRNGLSKITQPAWDWRPFDHTSIWNTKRHGPGKAMWLGTGTDLGKRRPTLYPETMLILYVLAILTLTIFSHNFSNLNNKIQTGDAFCSAPQAKFFGILRCGNMFFAFQNDHRGCSKPVKTR